MLCIVVLETLALKEVNWFVLMTNRQEEERRRREEEMMRQREIEEQMRRKREESYRMGGFMDNVSNASKLFLVRGWLST